MLRALLPRLGELVDWNPEAIKALFEAVCQEMDVKLGKVAQPVRVAVSGTTISPSIEETLVRVGKDRTISRIGRCLSVCA